MGGAHVNYHWLIHYLILLKGEFHRVKTEKYQVVLNELSTYVVDNNSDSDCLPNHKDLAKKFNFSQLKMNTILKDLFEKLINELSDPPLIIKYVVHQIHIHFPYDEENKMDKDVKEKFRKESIWIEMVLPVTPRIGDEISIPMIEHIGKFYRGYVHEVHHAIKGTTQEIYLEVHPNHDYYHRWIKMKQEYEDWKRWIASLKK